MNIINYLDINLSKWEIFQFGSTNSHRGGTDTVTMIDEINSIIEYDFCFSTNFLIYNKSVYDTIISFENNLNNHRSDAIDVRSANEDIKFWSQIPFLSYQTDGYSDIGMLSQSTKQLFLDNEKYLKYKLR